MLAYRSRNSIATSGSHFTLKLKGEEIKDVSRNTFPFTLKTRESSPKGKPSVVSGRDSAKSLSSSMFISKKEDKNIKSIADTGFVIKAVAGSLLFKQDFKALF